jgi:hypothetical protein
VIEIFDHVEDLMADVSMIFQGFTLTEMSAMSIDDLKAWRERARIRSEL